MTDIQQKITAKLSTMNPDLKDFILRLNSNTALTTIKKKYRLNDDDAETLESGVFSLILGLKTSIEFDEDIVNLTSLDETTAEALVDETLESFVEKVFEQYNIKDKNVLQQEQSSDSLLHKDILKEIENPTPSVSSTVSAVQKNAAPVGITTTGTGELGGFKPAAPLVNPATAIATKLDQKLAAPSSTAPKEVYQIKRPDPYHEPIDA